MPVYQEYVWIAHRGLFEVQPLPVMCTEARYGDQRHRAHQTIYSRLTSPLSVSYGFCFLQNVGLLL